MTRLVEHVAATALPYDLRIGITGHRDLAEPAAVKDGVRRLLGKIRAGLKPTAEIPLTWTVVSPLATGADQVVAEEILALNDARLEVVTPFALDEYRHDFGTGESLASFERLLARAGIVHELQGERANQNDAYLRVGKQVVDTCELMIAVWNGKPAEDTGGTGDIVEYAVSRGRKVIWLSTTDVGSDATLLIRDGTRGIGKRRFPDTADQLSPGFVQQREFVTSSIPPDRLQEAIGQALRQFGGLVGVNDLVRQFARADAFAQTYQRRHRRSMNAVIYLAAVAISIAVAQVTFFPDQHWLSFVEALAMVGVFAAWMISRRQGWHRSWLQNRYLAERLRATVFLELLDRADTRSENDPLPYYPGPSQWIKWFCGRLGASLSQSSPPLDRHDVLSQWLDDQRAFHSKTADETEGRVRRRHELGFALFALTLVMALLHAFGVGGLTTFFALVAPVWAGAVHAATVQLELERVAARSVGMTSSLDALIAQTSRARTVADLERVIDDATALMTTESREWWTLLSFQDVKLHV